ncbi:MAG: 2-iminoacetate synthase ThiH, partial [Anaerococcus obesiensis]
MNIKKVTDYFPEMDIIDSKIKTEVLDNYEKIKNKNVSDSDILSSLEKERLDEKDFYNLLSDKALSHLEKMGKLAKDKRVR